jgi:hypothetical protein
MTKRVTRHTRLQHTMASPMRAGRRAGKHRHEATRPQEYKKTRLAPGQVFALFNPRRAAQLIADGMTRKKNSDGK